MKWSCAALRGYLAFYKNLLPLIWLRGWRESLHIFTSYPQQWFIKLSEKSFYVLKPIFKTLKMRVLDPKENINLALCTFLQNRTKGHSEAMKQTGELKDSCSSPAAEEQHTRTSFISVFYWVAYSTHHTHQQLSRIASTHLSTQAIPAAAQGGCEDFMPPPTCVLHSSSDLAEQTHTCYI